MKKDVLKTLQTERILDKIIEICSSVMYIKLHTQLGTEIVTIDRSKFKEARTKIEEWKKDHEIKQE